MAVEINDRAKQFCLESGLSRVITCICSQVGGSGYVSSFTRGGTALQCNFPDILIKFAEIQQD